MDEASSKNVPHLRETVPPCATVIRGWMGGSGSEEEACTVGSQASVQTLDDAACKYGVDCGIAWLHRTYATSRAAPLQVSRARM